MKLVALCSSKSPVAKKGSLAVKDLLNIPIACASRLGTLDAINYHLQKHKLKISDLNVGVRLAGTEALKNFLREDNCVGFLPKRSVIRELERGELVAVKIEKLKIIRDFFFIQRKGSENDGLNKAFIILPNSHITNSYDT
jgi:DNA-binding transcriptional LysR family regulator